MNQCSHTYCNVETCVYQRSYTYIHVHIYTLKNHSLGCKQPSGFDVKQSPNVLICKHTHNLYGYPAHAICLIIDFTVCTMRIWEVADCLRLSYSLGVVETTELVLQACTLTSTHMHT